MIFSYNKIKLIQDLEEYIKYRLIFPTDYILVLNKNVSFSDSKLIASWNFTKEELDLILENISKDEISFLDTDNIPIPYSLLELMTIEEYFEFVRQDIYKCNRYHQNPIIFLLTLLVIYIIFYISCEFLL